MMLLKFKNTSFVEVLESRIAPATVIAATGNVGAHIVSAIAGAPSLLHAGDTLSTQGAGGAFLMYVESGSALVFSTDLNKNGIVDPNEITGIAAGDGLRLISFVDIHGDIVTDLTTAGTLSDSDNNASNNDPLLKGDGRVLLNNTIEKIELRSLTQADLSGDQNSDGVVDDNDVLARLAYSQYSIFGNIYAGKGFGLSDGTGGLTIDTAGSVFQTAKFVLVTSFYLYKSSTPTIGGIYTGTAASSESFSFGTSEVTASNIGGKIGRFSPPSGQVGGDINGVRAVGNSLFNLDGLFTGDGGFGARGGNIANVTISGDTAGGYQIITGNGGNGFNGGQGGSILSFSDLGSVTGEILIRSGDGGIGLTGIGGNGGAGDFDTMNLFGNVSIVLGSGGDGFKGGGSGSSLGTITFTSTQDANADTIGVKVISSWRDPFATGDNFGRTLPIDFNHDGIGDLVFTTSNPSQLIVELGDGSGGFTQMDLPVAGTPSALTVGDFNNDGVPDIAVGLSDAGSSAGVAVYLSRSADLDGNGTLETFTGFSSAHYSPLPHLFVYPGQGAAYQITGQPITALTSGDFNGDGVTDIAAVATYTSPVTGIESDVLLVLQGNAAIVGTADYGSGSKNVTSGNTFANFANGNVPVSVIGLHGTPVQLQSIGLSDPTNDGGAPNGVTGNDALIISKAGNKNFVVAIVPDASTPGVIAKTTISLGTVDSNRKVVDTNGNEQTALQSVSLLTFTVGDLDGDGFGDVAVLAQNPSAFLVTFTGDGTGAFNVASGTGNQAGIKLVASGSDDPLAPIGDTAFAPSDVAITTGESGGSDIAVYGVDNGGSHVYTLALDQFIYPAPRPGVAEGNLNHATVITSLGLGGDPQVIPNSPQFFDVYRPDAATVQFVNAHTTDNVIPYLSVDGFLVSNLFNAGIALQAGDGGDSTVGKGGNGGSFNGSTLGALSFDGTGFEAALGYDPGLSIIAGNGGSGFLNGGDGGTVRGVISTVLGTSILAGNGGDSIKSKGGSGGTISNSALNSGTLLAAGDGGSGRQGGAGGNVMGNQTADLPDTITAGVDVKAGDGGNGISLGGKGGSILNFSARLGLTSAGFALSYVAGVGGDAASGIAGAGGSVLNSSPRSDSNGFGGTIYVSGGDGGNGLVGGAGGSIVGFANNSTENTVPQLLTFLGGNGGFGVTGNGGKGGSVLNVQATGTAFDTSTSTSQTNTVLAGNGGASYGAKGGDGGSIGSSTQPKGIVISAIGGAVIAAAGAGGVGLTKGGLGGSLLNSVINASQPAGSKVLLVAGAGGDAHSFTAAEAKKSNPLLSDAQLATISFGTVNGVGGNGGSIKNLSQTGSVTTKVDLIAGNGGSTVNYGSASPTSIAKIGKGGSITNVDLAGTIGNTATAVPIQSYGLTAAFLAGFRDNVVGYDQGLNLAPQLTDSDGNVGLVAGAAGRVKGDFPATLGVNGSVKNLTARSIMSMVAGSVDRIASIQSANNIHITLLNGDAGSDKSVPAPPASSGVLDYLDQNGAYTQTAQLGGALIDGAIVTKNRISNADGTTSPTGPRVFVLS